MGKIKEYWIKNRSEIIETITGANQNVEGSRKNRKRAEEKIEKERKYIKAPLLIGILYVALGILLIVFPEHYISLMISQGNMLLAYVLMVLGTYALLYAFIFFCVYGKCSKYWWVKILKGFFVFLMFPYHVCIKNVKKIIKESKQAHVTYLFPYYLLSLLFVLFSFVFLVKVIPKIEIIKGYDELTAFIIAFFLVVEFFEVGKFFSFLLTKSLVWSIQKYKIKSESKEKWRDAMKQHKQVRQDMFDEEWKIVKEELEYSEIYFYMILNIVILILPKAEGGLGELLATQLVGITTIAALGREAKSKNKS